MTEFAGVVILYQPDEDVIKNIMSYVQLVKTLYVVDNTEHFSDEVISVVKKIKALPHVEYLAMPDNPGIAVALNCAFKKAKEEGYEWIISLDQDSNFKSNILDVYQGKINSNVPDANRVAIYTPIYVFERKRDKKIDEDCFVKLTMQSASLFNLSIFNEIGPFREDFFLDCVDYDYCCKAIKCNYHIVQCAKALLNHNPGITKTKKILFFKYKYGYMSPLRLYYQVRNLLQLSKEYKSFYLFAFAMWKIFKVVFFFDSKKNHLKAALKAVCDFKNKRFGKI